MAPSFPPTRASTTSLGCPTPTTRAPARISRASHPTPSALGAVTKVWCQSRSSAARASCSSPSLSLFWCRSTTNSPGTSSPTVPDEASPSCSTKHPTIHQLRSKVSEEHEVIKKKELETGPKASYGYGGKFGTERDRMDKITPRASVAATAWRRTRWTKQLWVLTARARRRSTTLRKSAAGFNEMAAATSSYEKTRPVEAGASSGPGSLRSRFENMAKLAEEESRRQAEEERVRRQAQGERASLVEAGNPTKREGPHRGSAAHRASKES
ncbi:hematopoietic lineage cell-specific protein-like isoform X7 [Phaenicophaeus curvirostris]|uniref:hematopoietic lineage cell-specific protein-like isoform X7 n=1 Tax=Phaenicophaeus curvirostris TaxID=33595 RepID=UPI0037F0D95D